MRRCAYQPWWRSVQTTVRTIRPTAAASTARRPAPASAVQAGAGSAAGGYELPDLAVTRLRLGGGPRPPAGRPPGGGGGGRGKTTGGRGEKRGRGEFRTSAKERRPP